MSTTIIQTIHEVIDQYIPIKRRGRLVVKVRQVSDRELRRHRASQAAIRNYELSKDTGLIASARSYFVR